MYIIRKNKILTKELIIRTVKFFCIASYVENEKDILNFLQTHKNKTVNHNAYAYVIGKRREIIFKTDNGEIRHLAGKTILQNIIAKDLTNIIVLVQRTFNPNSNLDNEAIQNGYQSITQIVLDETNLKKINGHLKIGILLRPLNEIFLLELFAKYKIKINTRLVYRGDLIISIIVNQDSKLFLELDFSIINKRIYNYKILKT